MRYRLRVVEPLMVCLCVLLSLHSAGATPVAVPTDAIRRIPPSGVAIPAEDRSELEAGVASLGKQIDHLRAAGAANPRIVELLPDVQIYFNAVRYALAYDEFFDPREIPIAKALLRQGEERVRLLADGKAPWTTATGLVVRGYVSKIDGSVQPYGLVVPATFDPASPREHRLDVWFHGRAEKLSELNFIDDRQTNPGQFTPRDTFVLHPYGRYCNANKFAGEVDLFEALDHVRRSYRIDENRVSVRGFSMGGAACWQFATHYAGLWAAAAPGAGFAETAEFLELWENEKLAPTWYEKKLWHLYDCTDYALNLINCPTVAYSGEIDKQRQAADIMARALKAEGIELAQVIGPQTAHAYHPLAKDEIDRRIDAIVARGRNPVPSHVRFTTWTLRYNRMLWVTVDGLDEHWERAVVDAEIADPRTVRVSTLNVSALTLSMPSGLCPLDASQRPRVRVDAQTVLAPPVLSDRSWTVHLVKSAGRWAAAAAADDGGLRKRAGLQGPIDDAFMDSFLMVMPTGRPMTVKTGAWIAAEQAQAIEHWRRQFRGEARTVEDAKVTDDDIASSNLVLWGDPTSNQILARIADRLPVRWDARGVHVGAQTYSGDHYVPVLIYPNPLNPKRYVVINSGFTFREYAYLNNARQIPTLPDYAVVDIDVAVSPTAVGGIVSAGFFGERWELKPPPRR